MALFATGRHPINLDKGLHTPVGSRAQGGSLSTTEPLPTLLQPPALHSGAMGKSNPPPCSALFLSPLQLKALHWENHGKGMGTKLALEQLCHPRTRPIPGRTNPAWALTSFHASLLHLLHSHLGHRFLRGDRGGLHCYAGERSRRRE